MQAFRNNDLDEIMKDYSEESELWIPEGAIVGREAISTFYSKAFSLLPKDKTLFEMKQMIVKGGKAYIVWSASSPVVNIPTGTDSFEIKGGKIIWQSAALHMQFL